MNDRAEIWTGAVLLLVMFVILVFWDGAMIWLP